MSANRFGSCFLAISFIGAATTCALAQVSPEIVKESSGTFLVATDDGKPGCHIELTTTKIKGDLYKAVPAQDCTGVLPNIAKAAAWEVADGTKLYDAESKPLIHFEEDETTFQKTRGEATPVTMLVQAKPGVDHAPSAAALLGTWSFKRPSGPALCEITFSDKSAGSDDSHVLSTATGCDKAISSLKLDSWRIEDFAVMLYGANDKTLRLEPIAEGFEKAQSEGGKPLVLTRK